MDFWYEILTVLDATVTEVWPSEVSAERPPRSQTHLRRLQEFRLVELIALSDASGAALFRLQHGAQIRLLDQRHSVIFDEQLVDPEKAFPTSSLHAIWWQPSGSESNFVLSNTSNLPVEIDIGIGFGSRSLRLGPRQSRLVRFTDSVVGKPQHSEPLIVSINHSGPPGAVMARGFVQQPEKGFSCSIEFSDPSRMKTSELHGAGLRLIAANEKLQPLVLLANLGETASFLRGALVVTASEEIHRISLRTVSIKPHTVQVLSKEILKAISEEIQLDSIDAAGLEFTYSTEPGTVMISAYSLSPSGDLLFRVPMKNVSDIPASAGGFPWDLSAGGRSTAYFKNISQSVQRYTAQLNSGGQGIYTFGLKEIEPGETHAIDIDELKAMQTPDEFGRTISMDTESGQIIWSASATVEPVLIGRVEQTNYDVGVSSSYSCLNVCPDSFFDSRIPDDVDASPTGLQAQAQQQDKTAYGTLMDWYNVYPGVWDTSNPSVARVNSTGYVPYGTVEGESQISAWWNVFEFFQPSSCSNEPGLCGVCLINEFSARPSFPIGIGIPILVYKQVAIIGETGLYERCNPGVRCTPVLLLPAYFGSGTLPLFAVIDWLTVTTGPTTQCFGLNEIAATSCFPDPRPAP